MCYITYVYHLHYITLPHLRFNYLLNIRYISYLHETFCTGNTIRPNLNLAK